MTSENLSLENLIEGFCLSCQMLLTRDKFYLMTLCL
jgi:hypothetical protein